ncbi:MAG: glycosyltransferase [Candidatus Cyclonatronum sp.]|uniref:glycosyltransferase n=1 Tax=Cyclonatronum sp. TaxID=3024185 RepID=UPI0025B856C1|nr:glycosyltransferase [Cyclonatronum sp.]MCH8485515.1 glycosyltransferase [Cyclonatronum sp.]
MADKPPVLMLASSRSVHTQRWAMGMYRLGWPVHLLTADPDELLDYGPVPVIRLPGTGKATFFTSAHKVRKLHRALKPGLVHAFYATNYGFLAALAGCRPLLLSVMGTDVFSYPNKSFLHLAGTSAILKRADYIAATSKIMVRRVRWLKSSPARIAHTPFGTDLNRFRPAARNSLPGRENTFRIISVRHLEHKYGLDVLIDGAALLRRQLPRLNFSLDICGEGPERKALEARIAGHGLQDICRMPGAVSPEALPQLLQNADIAVVPSREESFGVSVIEASACGIPVIGSKVGGIPEVIREGETGLLFPSQNAAALEVCLSRMATEPYTRQRMGLAGRRFVEETYSEEACLARMDKLYTKLTRK